MANSDTPFGLVPIGRNGGTYDGSVNLYYIPSTDGTACAVGDAVKLAGSADSRGVPTIARATAGDIPVGIIVGFVPVSTALDVPDYRAASTARYAQVADDPDIFFVIQEDSVGGALDAASVGLNADMVFAAPSATTGISNVELDSSTALDTATLDLQIIRLWDAADNAIGTNAKWVCKFNTHQYAKGRTGV